MKLKSQREVDVTRRKLADLERMYAEALADFEGSPQARGAEVLSLMRTINQLKEEIARYEAHRCATGEALPS